ncbi:MAG TPA: VTT domain-containing protein [Dehalococcoidia bacterium]|nr:VTT domain-containing protein [Dehalococcoidia bacterium]
MEPPTQEDGGLATSSLLSLNNGRLAEAAASPPGAKPVEAQGATLKRAGVLWFSRRLEFALLLAVAGLTIALGTAFFYLGLDLDNFKSYGYAGLFVINLLGAASIVLPSPAAASIFGEGAFLGDFLNVPAFFWVGLVAGLAEAIGEFSGYAAGYGSRLIVLRQPLYQRVYSWMERRRILTIFVMSIIPNPIFDLAGVAAGAVRMPLLSFFTTVLTGRIIKGWYMAGLGALGVSLLTGLG